MNVNASSSTDMFLTTEARRFVNVSDDKQTFQKIVQNCSKLMTLPNRVESYNSSFITPMAEFILSKTKYRPQLGIVCGTGLGGIVNSVTDQDVLPYSSIPKFPQSTVPGHAGNLIFGLLSGKPVLLMQGRFHLFEGYTPQECAIPIRVMKLIGVHTIILTNASGCLNPEYKVGDVMIIRDHINLPGLSGLNPLVGENDTKFGSRFVALSDAYDVDLIKMAHECAKSLGHDNKVHEGVYAMQLGPSYESIAESRMLKAVGADVVGMSTCPEVLVARHCSMRVFAMSLITNIIIQEYDSKELVDHEDVLKVGKKSAIIVKNIIDKMVQKIIFN